MSTSAARTELIERLRHAVRDVPDFPRQGVVFKDLTPVWRDPHLWRSTLDALAEPFRERQLTHVAGVEARGFLIAGALSDRLRTGVVPLRKPGKLPWSRSRVGYDLEYGTDALEVHVDAFGPGDRVLLVDDVLATGGTAAAAVELVRGSGAEVAGTSFLLEIAALGGRRRLEGVEVHVLLSV